MATAAGGKGIGDLIGLAGSIFGGIQGSQQQGQEQNAFNQLFGLDTGVVNQLMQSYFGQGGGGSALSSLIPGLSGQIGGNEKGVQGAANTLMNWKGLQPGEMGAMESSMLNQNNNLINTFKQNEGGTANPGAVIENLAQGGQQNALNLGSQLGSMAEQQELGAREAGGGLLSSLLGQNLGSLLGATGQQGSLLEGGMGQLGGLQSMLGGMMQQQGSPWGNMLSGLAGNPALSGSIGGGKGKGKGGGTNQGGQPSNMLQGIQGSNGKTLG